VSQLGDHGLLNYTDPKDSLSLREYSMTNQQKILSIFLALIERQENETLDFKRDAYNLSKEEEKLELVKDIVCMYNTPREEDAHIVLGVKEHKNRPHELFGIDPNTNPQHLDQSDLQGLFLEKFRVEPFPEFRIDILQDYEGKSFGIITIPVKRVGPCKFIKGDGEKLKSGSHIYFRRGTSKDITRSPEEIYEIMRWFQDGLSRHNLSSETPQWDNFLEAASISISSGFDLSRKYITIASPLRNENIETLSVLGEISSSVVLDFDHHSDVNGLLYAVKGRLNRSLHTLVKRDRLTINPEGTTYWFFARGLEGREGTIETGDHKTWRKSYVSELGEQLRNFARVMSPTPVTCIALWYQDTHLIRHLRSTLESVEQTFENAVNFVIVTTYPGELHELADDFDAELIEINLHQLCSGLEFLISSGVRVEADECLLPSSSNAPIPLNYNDRKWLEEELEIVHLNIGAIAPNLNEPVGRRFLSGAEITWHELSLHSDVDREKAGKVKRQVETELLRRHARTVTLYHEAGAGGTTVARRILWELHSKYPCAILNRSKPFETSERLFRLASLTGQSILLLIDSAQVPERQVEELYNYVRSRLLPVVLLHIQRGFKPQKEKDRVSYLEALLSNRECWQFVEKFSQFEPEKRQELEKLITSPEPKFKTAFYFGLQTFGREFRGLERYVSNRLQNLSPDQKKLLFFLSIAHHYAQHPIKAQAFASSWMC
jgi:hypothetical protein